ncbi:ricin-type beta-trefoil lectin domain protein [Symbiopectobacterium sp. Eva_TO]
MKLAIMTTCLCLSVPVSFSALVASDVTENIMTGAQVHTVTQTVKSGFISIANGRNCAVASADNHSSILSPCPSQPSQPEEIITVYYIELQNGMCLEDRGGSTVALKRCRIGDGKQQWKRGVNAGTELKNVVTGKCLTTQGLNKQLKVASCNGSPAQYWKLPQ